MCTTSQNKSWLEDLEICNVAENSIAGILEEKGILRKIKKKDHINFLKKMSVEIYGTHKERLG